MKVLHIIAISCIVVGLLLGVTALALEDFNMYLFDTNKYIEGSETLTADFAHIKIDTIEGHIRLIRTEEDTCRVEYKCREKVEYRIAVEDDTLVIKTDDQRKWYDHITFFSFLNSELTIYLPESHYASLRIETTTGKVEIPRDFDFDTATVEATTGHIDYAAYNSENVTLSVTTGNVTVRRCTLNQLSVESTTGDIIVNSVNAGKMKLELTTGDIQVDNCVAGSLAIQSSTGDVELENTRVINEMKITATTGDVEFEHCDAGSILIETTTGDVEGSLLSPKIFIANTDTGDVRVPQTTTGGTCKITCTTGDIEITIQ